MQKCISTVISLLYKRWREGIREEGDPFFPSIVKKLNEYRKESFNDFISGVNIAE